MSTLRPNPYKVLLLSQDRQVQTSNQSMLIRRYRLARLRPEARLNGLNTRVEQVRRASR